MSYENAPATQMLATHCAVCCRPLLDAVSVNLGIGPECRKYSGYDIRVDEEKRAEANKLVHAIACGQSMSFTDLAAACTELTLLGFSKLAETISKRRASISISEESGRLLVKTPFTEGSLKAIRAIRGRRPEYEKVNVKGQGLVDKFRGNSFPMVRKPEVWAMIKRCFPGAMGVGPKGAFVVPFPDEDPSPLRHVATLRVDRHEEPLPRDCHDTGCPTCGDEDYHDGEPCPEDAEARYEEAMERKAEEALARRRGEF